MKKAILSLAVAALILTAGMLGFYLGRNMAPSPILVEKYPEQTAAPVPTTETPSESTIPAGPVNINTASLDELQTLTGIGPVLAQRIIDYREENGPFETVSQLTMVSGIGMTRLEELLDYITVGGET
jgi:comEA protein